MSTLKVESFVNLIRYKESTCSFPRDRAVEISSPSPVLASLTANVKNVMGNPAEEIRVWKVTESRTIFKIIRVSSSRNTTST